MRFEYFENEMIVLVLIVLSLSILSPDNNKISYISYLFILSYPFFMAFYTKHMIGTNIEQFNKGKTFICNSDNRNRYVISRKDGWEVFDLYFKKDSLLVKIKRCDEN